MDTISGLLLGVLSCLMYDIMKNWIYKNMKLIKSGSAPGTYSFGSVKAQFYIAFPLAVVLVAVKPLLKNQFVSTACGILLFFALFFSFCAFACMVEIAAKVNEKPKSEYSENDD